MKRSKIADVMWRRHANPWSAWTRLLSTPLIYVPFWNHSWLQGLAVAAWFVVNPFLFPEPSDPSAWAARAIRGERQWMKQHRHGASTAIQAIGSVALLGGCYTAFQHMLWPTLASALAVIAGNTWFLHRMTRRAGWREDG